MLGHGGGHNVYICAVVLEAVAGMALDALSLCPDAAPAPDYVIEKHYQRKHGPKAYYGQK